MLNPSKRWKPRDEDDVAHEDREEDERSEEAVDRPKCNNHTVKENRVP